MEKRKRVESYFNCGYFVIFIFFKNTPQYFNINLSLIFYIYFTISWKKCYSRDSFEKISCVREIRKLPTNHKSLVTFLHGLGKAKKLNLRCKETIYDFLHSPQLLSRRKEGVGFYVAFNSLRHIGAR